MVTSLMQTLELQDQGPTILFGVYSKQIPTRTLATSCALKNPTRNPLSAVLARASSITNTATKRDYDRAGGTRYILPEKGRGFVLFPLHFASNQRDSSSIAPLFLSKTHLASSGENNDLRTLNVQKRRSRSILRRESLMQVKMAGKLWKTAPTKVLKTVKPIVHWGFVPLILYIALKQDPHLTYVGITLH
ncbi:hypothetical protein PsorP6_007734 [Peronosclerospora sorghi]|uniref:Uncharacterized protein n=1 Tax=Peronosclerospora sorghi TaxID=230839 RepID=A0ACC0WC85_9STRA|nr:hypothetical protein PsorP6_007734 [Peronosclerospora sorghi]